MNQDTHRARKRFGQNFLHDQGIIERIRQAINPAAGDNMVEIGPGKGAITVRLLETLKHLHVVELDRDLPPILKHTCADSPGTLDIHLADALKFDFCQLAETGARLRVVGNLPYNISTPLLFHLFDQIDCIQDMHFMLQKEVINRITASPGNKSWGRLSVMVQYYCSATSLFTILPGAFNPAPKVDSAFVRLVPHKVSPWPETNSRRLETLVTSAFAQRRKTLRNNLKGILDEEQIRSVGIDPGCRPETLGVEEFCRLCNLLPEQETG